MEIKLNIEEILTSDEIKEIAIEQIREFFRVQTESDLTRIMSNLGHEISSMILCESIVDDEKLQILKETIDKIFKNNDSIKYALLRSPDAWDMSETSVHKVFKDAVISHKDLIKENAKRAIQDLNAKDFKQWIITAKHSGWI